MHGHQAESLQMMSCCPAARSARGSLCLSMMTSAHETVARPGYAEHRAPCRQSYNP